jgi:hypothetical protein
MNLNSLAVNHIRRGLGGTPEISRMGGARSVAQTGGVTGRATFGLGSELGRVVVVEPAQRSVPLRRRGSLSWPGAPGALRDQIRGSRAQGLPKQGKLYARSARAGTDSTRIF